MAAKTYVERTLETVVEFQDTHTQRLAAMAERFEADLAKVMTALNALESPVVQTSVGIKQNSQNSDEPEQQPDRIVNTFDNQQQVANKQLDRIARTLENQQQLVNKQAETASILAQGVKTLTQRTSWRKLS
jgi:prefoldin subunit 5